MKFSQLSIKPEVLIAAFAVVFALLVGLSTYFVMRIYQNTQPIWVEQAAYGQWPMLRFLSLIRQNGILSAIQHSLTTHDFSLNRHLLELWLLGVVAPDTLTWFHAPLLVVTPILALFSGLFGWTVYRRTEHVGYSVAAIALFGALAQLTRHNWGIGSGFADWQSMLLLSSSILCLFNALTHPGLAWFLGFVIFLALSVLSRITSAFYAAVLCGPLFLMYLSSLYRRTKSPKQIWHTLAIALIIMAPIIAIMLLRLPELLTYYGSGNAWNLKQPLLESARSIFVDLLTPFMGVLLILFCFYLLFANALQMTSRPQPGSPAYKGFFVLGSVLCLSPIFYVWMKLTFSGSDLLPPFLFAGGFGLWLAVYVGMSFYDGSRELATAGMERIDEVNLSLLWWSLGFLGFLLFNGYTSDVPKEAMYAVPPILLICLAPFSKARVQLSPRFMQGLSIVIMAFAVISFFAHLYVNARFAGTVTFKQQSIRRIQLEMAETLSTLPSDILWQNYTNIDWDVPVTLLTQYEYRAFRESSGKYFYNRKEYWDTWYPDLALEQLQEKLYSQASNCIDIAVVLADPDQRPSGMEEYSYSLASFISRQVQSDPSWRYITELDGWPEGTRYRMYQNRQATHPFMCAG